MIRKIILWFIKDELETIRAGGRNAALIQAAEQKEWLISSLHLSFKSIRERLSALETLGTTMADAVEGIDTKLTALEATIKELDDQVQFTFDAMLDLVEEMEDA